MILYSFVAHDEELDAKFQAYQVDLLSKICDHVGWNAQPDEPHVTNLLRYVFDCLAFSEGSVVNNQRITTYLVAKSRPWVNIASDILFTF